MKKYADKLMKLYQEVDFITPELRKIGITLIPFMPETAENILKQLGIKDEELQEWESIYKYENMQNIKVIEKGEPLFMRLDTEQETEYIKNAMKK